MIILLIWFQSLTASLQSCDFESGLCAWSQDHTDDFDWTRDNGGTSSAGTGPSFDHTTQTTRGYYIYIETSRKRANMTARIISGSLGSLGSGHSYGPICVSFWYHMYGAHVNVLNLYQQEADMRGAPLWTKQGNQGNKWIQAQVDVRGRSGDQVCHSITYMYSQTCVNRSPKGNIKNGCLSQVAAGSRWSKFRVVLGCLGWGVWGWGS